MELTVEQRNTFGKAVKSLRKKGLIPAELYGRGIENMHVVVKRKEFAKIFKEAGESSVITLRIGGDTRSALINDVGYDPVTDEVVNVDFYQIRLDEKIRVKVPIEFTGESPAVKAGGVLVKAMKELEVEALPTTIPHAFTVDVSEIKEIGQSIYVEQLSIPKDIKVLVSLKTVVASVTAKMTEEQEAALAQEGNVEAVKVEVEEKKAEREATKEAQGTTEEKKAGTQ